MNIKTKSIGALFIHAPIPARIYVPNGNTISTLRALKMAHEVILQSTIDNNQDLEDKKMIVLDDLTVMIKSVK